MSILEHIRDRDYIRTQKKRKKNIFSFKPTAEKTQNPSENEHNSIFVSSLSFCVLCIRQLIAIELK